MLTTLRVIGRFLLFSPIIPIASAELADARAVRCDIIEKYQCEPHFGCSSIDSRVWNIVDLATSSFSRCDSFGCDDYNAVISSADGLTMSIEIPGVGLFATIAPDGTSFSEMATIGRVVVVSFGACRDP